MNQKAWKIFGILFVSSIGDNLFRSSIAIFLLKQGFSAFETSGAIAATALPNAILGPILGRFVDNANKRKIFLILSIIIAFFEILILASTGWFGIVKASWLLPMLMIFLGFSYSPYLTLVYQYLIPSLGNDESELYSRWEAVSSVSAVSGGILTFILLIVLDPGWLLVADAVTFCLAGGLIYKIWSYRDAESQSDSEQVKCSLSFQKRVLSVLSDRRLLIGAVGMWCFAFLIDAIVNNDIVIGLKELKIKQHYLGLATSIFAVIGWVGAVTYNHLPERLRRYHLSLQSLILISCVPGLVALVWGISNQNTVLAVLSLLWFGFLDPFWSINNMLLLRSRIPEGRYGEIFGFIRVPRALLTMVGTSLIGWFQDRGILQYGVIATVVILVGFVALTQFTLGHYELSAQKRK